MQSKISEEYLSKLVSRLEVAVNKLESKTLVASSSNTNTTIEQSTSEVEEKKACPINEFWNKTQKNLEEFETCTKETNMPVLDKIFQIVKEALCAHQDILTNNTSFKKPEKKDLKPLTDKIVSITSKLLDLSKANRDVQLHCDAVKNGLDSIFWVLSDAQCDMTTQTYLEAIDFAGNKIMFKKNPSETKWIKTFKVIIKDIDTLVKGNFKFGLPWNSNGQEDLNKFVSTIGATLNDLANAPAKPINRGRRDSLATKGRQESHNQNQSIFTYENLENETIEVNPEKLEDKCVVIVNNSINSTVNISKKVTSVKLNNCDNVTVLCESLLSGLEIYNSINTKVQINDLVHTINIKESEGVSLHLHENSKTAKIIASKSFNINVRLSKENDMTKFDDIKLPDQFVYTIGDDRKVNVNVN